MVIGTLNFQTEPKKVRVRVDASPGEVIESVDLYHAPLATAAGQQNLVRLQWQAPLKQEPKPSKHWRCKFEWTEGQFYEVVVEYTRTMKINGLTARAE